MEDNDIKPWLTRMRQGDSEAFQIVYEATHNGAYRLIYYLAPNKQDAEDIMNEVYIELLKSLSNYQYDEKFSSWFNGLIVRQVRNWKRKGWRRFRLLEKIKFIFGDTNNTVGEDKFSGLISRMELLPLLENLPLKLREVIVLRYYQDCSMEEIAYVLNKPLGTIKSRHHHALKRLRHLFQEHNQGEGEQRNVN